MRMRVDDGGHHGLSGQPHNSSTGRRSDLPLATTG
jgi:hypothetical protein